MSDKYLIGIISIVSFLGAIFSSIPGGEALQKLLILVIVVFSFVVKKRIFITKKMIITIWPFIIYLLIAGGSSLLNFGSFFLTIAAIQPLIIGLIIYSWASNTNNNIENLVYIKKMFFFIIIVQFVFVLIKIYVHKIDEKVFIGTMSHTAGQLGFLFPAIVIPILIFLIKPKKIYSTILFVIMMFMFGILNEKRSVIFLLPIVLFFSVIFTMDRKILKKKFLVFIIFSILIGFTGMYLGISLIPSLNPESKYGGGVSFSYAFKYVADYLTMNYGGNLQGSYEDAVFNRSIQVGRFILWNSIIEWIKNSDFSTMCFGVGYGAATPSVWLNEGRDQLFSIIGTRGAVSGAGISIIETGLLGFITISCFFLHIFNLIIIAKKRVFFNISKRWLYVVAIVHIIFCYDFFFYSTVLLRTLPMPLIFFVMISSIEHVVKLDKQLETSEESMNIRRQKKVFV